MDDIMDSQIKVVVGGMRQRVEEFLKSLHDEYQEEFGHIIEKINPELSLIDKLAAQRLLVRSAVYEVAKQIVAAELPEELRHNIDDLESETADVSRGA